MSDELKTPAMGSCFWSHQWSKWEQYMVNGSKFMATGKMESCSWLKQRRACIRCNKQQVEDISG